MLFRIVIQSWSTNILIVSAPDQVAAQIMVKEYWLQNHFRCNIVSCERVEFTDGIYEAWEIDGEQD